MVWGIYIYLYIYGCVCVYVLCVCSYTWCIRFYNLLEFFKKVIHLPASVLQTAALVQAIGFPEEILSEAGERPGAGAVAALGLRGIAKKVAKKLPIGMPGPSAIHKILWGWIWAFSRCVFLCDHYGNVRTYVLKSFKHNIGDGRLGCAGASW